MSSTSWGRYVHAGTNASTTSEGMDVESSSLHMYAVAKHMHAAIRARTITASQHAFIKVKLFKDDADDDDDDDEAFGYTGSHSFAKSTMHACNRFDTESSEPCTFAESACAANLAPATRTSSGVSELREARTAERICA